ncbi:MAG: DUF362 domain-containing protein [Candidatus Thorarchaeota archaeon]|nr:DUF362 domain-containing protein [Candidatus Thorarchaeota archaeon]
MSSIEPVAIIRANENIEEVLSNGIDLLGGLGQISSPVLIKPNICTISDESGSSVTDVKVIEAIANHFFKQDSSLCIRVVESDSESKFAEEAYTKYGYNELEKNFLKKGYDFCLTNLSKSSLKRSEFKGVYFIDPELPQEILQESYFVSVALAKTHHVTVLTGVLKNQFGLLPRKDQGFYHSHIDDVISDMNSIVRPKLSIIDARFGVKGWNGPKTKKIGAFILGKDPLSVDATLARIMGFEPEDVPHLMKAQGLGLGHLDPPILGTSIESVKVSFKSTK